MMKYSASMHATTGANKMNAWKTTSKTKLLTMLVVALPLLSMLAGAAMAAHHYGVL